MTAQQPPYVLADGSIQHDAEQFRRMVQSLAAPTTGVLAGADMTVAQRGAGANMSVDVSGGRAFILGTEATYQGSYWAENRGVRNVTISAANATNPRRDLIVARVRDGAYSGSSNDWDVVVVTGTPAASPADPATPANTLVLARVAVAANASSIVNANITDLRTFQNRIGCEAHSTAVQSMTVGIWNDLLLNSETYDPLGMHSTSADTARITIPAGLDGIYACTGYYEDLIVGSGLQLSIKRNGDGRARKSYVPPLDEIVWTGYLAAGDYVTMSLYTGAAATHNSNVSTPDSDGPGAPCLQVYKVG